jgi:hypothetical protein
MRESFTHLHVNKYGGLAFCHPFPRILGHHPRRNLRKRVRELQQQLEPISNLEAQKIIPNLS